MYQVDVWLCWVFEMRLDIKLLFQSDIFINENDCILYKQNSLLLEKVN